MTERVRGWKLQRLRRRLIQENPPCVKCDERGEVRATTELDHMPKLQTLKPRLRAIDSRRVRMLQHDTVNPRPRGEKWMETRRRIQMRDGSVCCDCGRLWIPHRDHVDHEMPRERGGSDDDSNLRLRCIECHKVKTAREARERWAMARSGGSH